MKTEKQCHFHSVLFWGKQLSHQSGGSEVGCMCLCSSCTVCTVAPQMFPFTNYPTMRYFCMQYILSEYNEELPVWLSFKTIKCTSFNDYKSELHSIVFMTRFFNQVPIYRTTKTWLGSQPMLAWCLSSHLEYKLIICIDPPASWRRPPVCVTRRRRSLILWSLIRRNVSARFTEAILLHTQSCWGLF